MIEIIYNKEKENAVGNEEYFCVPRNIRQIGDVPKENKIYMEDYVYTYLTTDWKEEEQKGKIAVLLGKYNWKNKVAYIFVKSAVAVEGIEVSRDDYPLTDEVWGKVYEEMKTYFPSQEVVGWCLSLPDSGLCMNERIVQTHLKHFGGNDKVLLFMDPYERESAFYLYRNNQMEKQKGYYIFYEKNDLMQEYMLAKNPDAGSDFSGKVQDRAVKDFRKIAAMKLGEKSGKDVELSWGHVACAGVVIFALAAGTIWVQMQQKDGQSPNAANSEEAAYVMEEYDTDRDDTENQGMTLLTPEVTQVPQAAEEEQPAPEAVSETAPESDPGTTPEIMQDTEQSTAPGTALGESEETAISVYTKYTVRQGDTISQICMRYYGDFSKVTEICKINNLLEEDVIYPGQTILLP